MNRILKQISPELAKIYDDTGIPDEASGGVHSPEHDKTLMAGMVPVRNVDANLGWGGLASIGQGIGRAADMAYNRSILDKVLGNMSRRDAGEQGALKALYGGSPEGTPSLAKSYAQPAAPAQVSASPTPPNPVTPSAPASGGAESWSSRMIGGVAPSSPATSRSTAVDFAKRAAILPPPHSAATQPESIPAQHASASVPAPVPAPQAQTPQLHPYAARIDAHIAQAQRALSLAPPGSKAQGIILDRLQRLGEAQMKLADPMREMEIQKAQLGLDHTRAQMEREAQMTPLDVKLKQNQVAQESRQFKQIGTDILGNAQYGFVDPVTQQITPANIPSQSGLSSNVGNPALHGEDFLKTLDPALADEIRGYADGRIPYSATMAAKPRGMALTKLIMQYDPSFDAVNYASRNATRRDFTSGSSAKNITSFNTAIGHISHLAEAVDGLNNGPFPALNQASNFLNRNLGNTDFASREKQFMTAKTAVAEELAKAFKGTGATNLEELHAWNNAINSADSPAALKASIKEAMKLLKSRIDSLGEQYNRGMGATRDPMDLLTPESKSAWRKLSGGSGGEIVSVTSVEEAKKLPVGTRFRTPDGQIMERY